MVDIVTEFGREDALSGLLYADRLVLIREAIKGLKYKFFKWKEAFGRKVMKLSFGKTKMMFNSGITKDDVSKKKFTHAGSAA